MCVCANVHVCAELVKDNTKGGRRGCVHVCVCQNDSECSSVSVLSHTVGGRAVFLSYPLTHAQL